MLRKLVLVIVVLAGLLVSTNAASGLQFAASLYVDLAYVGSEDGTMAKPYNSVEEATAVAQHLPYGADLYQKQADGSWKFLKTVNPVRPGQTGDPIARPVLLGILVALSLLLIVLGMRLRRQSRALAR